MDEIDPGHREKVLWLNDRHCCWMVNAAGRNRQHMRGRENHEVAIRKGWIRCRRSKRNGQRCKCHSVIDDNKLK